MRPAAILRMRTPAAAGGGYSYWNPSDKAANATLSDSNKVVTSASTATAWVRSVKAHATGKRRVEFVLVTMTGDPTGVGFAHTGDTGTYLGSNTVGYCLYGNYGGDLHRYYNGSGFPFSGYYIVSDVIGLIIDLDARLAWWDRNGSVISGDPAAGTGAMSAINVGDVYLAADAYTSGCAWRLRTDPAEMTYAAPSGFTNGWPD